MTLRKGGTFPVKPFEAIYNAGLQLAPKETKITHVYGPELSQEEKRLMEEYILGYMRNGGSTSSLVDVYMSGFFAGLGHAGTHFRGYDAPKT